MRPKDRQKLIKAIQQRGWQQLDESAMDAGYAELTADEKRAIVRSIVDGTPEARRLIVDKLALSVNAWAEAQADKIAKTGLVPVELIINRL